MVVVISQTIDMDLVLQDWSKEFDRHLDRAIQHDANAPSVLADAMKYSLCARGKRIRPFLVDRCHRLVGGTGSGAERACVAVECAHVFTLIHDDLPCMDDARMRRGQPCNHKVFGEGIAVLAGDALLAYAFELLAQDQTRPTIALQMVRELAEAIGWTGVMAGQAMDLTTEVGSATSATVRSIHERKTARLFSACCRLGALAADARPDVCERLADFGNHLGLAFQIADDLLDAMAPPERLGKDSGTDQPMGKPCYPAIVGMEQTRRLGEQAVEDAIRQLSNWGPEADELRELARFVLQRSR